MTQPYLILPTTPPRNYKDADGARWFAPQLDEYATKVTATVDQDGLCHVSSAWYVERVDADGATVYTFETWPEAEEFWSGVTVCVNDESR